VTVQFEDGTYTEESFFTPVLALEAARGWSSRHGVHEVKIDIRNRYTFRHGVPGVGNFDAHREIHLLRQAVDPTHHQDDAFTSDCPACCPDCPEVSHPMTAQTKPSFPCTRKDPVR
jgi:hypothetical protein